MSDTETKMWNLFIMGFRQDTSYVTGMEILWKRVAKAHYGDKRIRTVVPMEWNTNFEALAYFIARNSCDDPIVNICAYSWGAGHGFKKLSKHLAKLGITVGFAGLCDPVYHSKLAPWRAIFPQGWLPPMKIEANVMKVGVVTQCNTRPRGLTKFDLEGNHTQVTTAFNLSMYNHYDIDESHIYSHMCLSGIEKATRIFMEKVE